MFRAQWYWMLATAMFAILVITESESNNAYVVATLICSGLSIEAGAAKKANWK